MEFTVTIPEPIVKPYLFFILKYRKFRYGYPFRRIPLTEGKFAIVDPEDFKSLNKIDWYLSPQGYGCTNEAIYGLANSLAMHRKIIPVCLPGYVVDHINQNKLDNRKDNLRIATRSQNNQNKPARPHTSKYKGVSVLKKNVWRARIAVDKKRIHLGYYKDEIEAAKAYDEAAKKYYGQFADLNFQK